VWLFVDKVPLFTDEDLEPASAFPRAGVIACQIVGRRLREDGVALVSVDTASPWGVAAVGGETRFEVLATHLSDCG